MAEFEELRLTVNLVDNASTGLVKIRTELDNLTKTAGQMTKSFSDATDSATKLGQAAVTVAPKLQQVNTELRALSRHAMETGRALGTMGYAAQQGLGGLPRMAMGLWDAAAGLKGLGEAVGKVAPAAQSTVMGLGGLTIGLAGLALAVGAYGISVFRFAKDMDQIGRTARTLGMSFAELKSAQDQAKAFGHSTESVVRSFQGIQAAQLDLYKNNSQLRQRLLSQGVDANWINQLANADPMRARTMIAQYGKALERQALEAGVGKSVAAAIRNQFYGEYGQKPEDMELALKPVSPERAAEMERVAEQSRRVMAIWAEISLKLQGLTFGALSAGLPVLLGSLRIVDSLFGAIGEGVTAIDTGLSLLGTNLLTVLKMVPLLGLGVSVIEGLYKLGGGGEDPNAGATAPKPQSYTPKEGGSGGSGNPLFQRIAFTTEELTEETGENTAQVEKLTSQLDKLNAYFERMEAQRNAAAGGGGGAGAPGSGVTKASYSPGSSGGGGDPSSASGGGPTGGSTSAPSQGGATPSSGGSTTASPSADDVARNSDAPAVPKDGRSAREAELSLGGDKRSAREAELSLGGGGDGGGGGGASRAAMPFSGGPIGAALQGLMKGMGGGGGLGGMRQMLSKLGGGGLPGMLSGLLGGTPFGGMLQGLMGGAMGRMAGAGGRGRGGGTRRRGGREDGQGDRRSAREAELSIVGGTGTFEIPTVHGSFPTLDSVPAAGKGSTLAGLQANPPGGGIPAYDRPENDPSGDYPGLDRSALDRSALSEAMKIRADGDVNVNIGKGPTKAAASRNYLFKNTELEKSQAGQNTQRGPKVSDSVDEYMDI